MPHYNAAEWISKSGLKARLWTDKAIAEFLGRPEKAGPVMAWRRKDVQKVEGTPAFQRWLAKCREWLAAQGKLPGEQQPSA
ncbi:putative plasmid-related protein [Serratia marcescens subsp. marcescens Db11]|uniref:Plasmid-related protein n=1 Tax=Serratia marcescens subsp. marcescens Db11 TaxID=273526 RepID=A0ABC9IQI4_SERMA|nr:hypothetical protein [Serratia marcescens]MBN5403517.1 hypothetical protein [Serratia marcescens]CDG15129.1 putative plasmid-related protein [Serratia marcescens subsp. marcescens Db11]